MLFTAYVVVYAQILNLKNKLSFFATSWEITPPPPLPISSKFEISALGANSRNYGICFVTTLTSAFHSSYCWIETESKRTFEMTDIEQCNP